jgi:hypothetical protein
MGRTRKKNPFPIGIFIALLFILMLLAAAISSLYVYTETKKRVVEAEAHIRNYSITLAEAFARVAELSYPERNFVKLKTLFSDKIRENAIDEAFFVLADGSIIVHSQKEITEKLKGNIANDEISYNLDLILQPLRTRSSETHFIDYHIIENTIPFDKYQRKLIKEFISPKIEINGWLVTRAVFVKNKPIGTVTFIISKNKLYADIISTFEESIKLFILLVLVAFIIALFISVIDTVRYRTISRLSAEAALAPRAKGELSELPSDSFIIQELGSGNDIILAGTDTLTDWQSDDNTIREAQLRDYPEGEAPGEITPLDAHRIIKDPIPVRRKGE